VQKAVKTSSSVIELLLILKLASKATKDSFLLSRNTLTQTSLKFLIKVASGSTFRVTTSAQAKNPTAIAQEKTIAKEIYDKIYICDNKQTNDKTLV